MVYFDMSKQHMKKKKMFYRIRINQVFKDLDGSTMDKERSSSLIQVPS